MTEDQENQNPENPRGINGRKLTNVVVFLILANVLVFIGQFVSIIYFDFNVFEFFALYNFKSEKFAVYQFVTYMFVHAGIFHLFLNMFILWMFGSVLEYIWNSKKFLFYFFLTGIGAALLHLAVSTFLINRLEEKVNEYQSNPTYSNYTEFVQEEVGEVPEPLLEDDVPEEGLPGGVRVLREIKELERKWAKQPEDETFRERSIDLVQQYLRFQIDLPSVGASGAVFGILLAFGMIFPNAIIYLFFMFPMKAKYFVILLGALELYFGVSQDDNIANFAHLGGMIFGYILLKVWREKPRENI